MVRAGGRCDAAVCHTDGNVSLQAHNVICRVGMCITDFSTGRSHQTQRLMAECIQRGGEVKSQ